MATNTTETVCKVPYGSQMVVVRTAGEGESIDVRDEIVDPGGFYANFKVDHVVEFGQSFSGLVGPYNEEVFGKWDIDALPGRGIVILEYYFEEAARIMDSIDKLAVRLIADPELYKDAAVATDYFNLADAGYSLMHAHQDEFSFSHGIPLSLERGGLVATRLGLRCGKDERIHDEVCVVTKRIHPLIDQTALSVTVTWRDKAKLATLNDAQVQLIDFVNPASGASTAAAILAAGTLGVKPRGITHRAIASTIQGISFNQQALEGMGIDSSFYSLGTCNQLAPNYYLSQVGRAVGDAGHILRHNLPDWYEQ